MFDNLSDRLGGVFKRIRGKGKSRLVATFIDDTGQMELV